MSAFAFDNIEADAIYERAIKEQISKEFQLGLKMLNDQATKLGMAVREKRRYDLAGAHVQEGVFDGSMCR